MSTQTQAGYNRYVNMAESRGPLAAKFATQIIETCRPFVTKPPGEWDVLDIGCGYAHTVAELARNCRSAVGIEPTADLYAEAAALATNLSLPTLGVRRQGIYELTEVGQYDLVVLDNVFEHLPKQAEALDVISQVLRPGGAAFLLMPNKLWPIEVHYRLPFLSYLPLGLANRYLRASGRGTDYADASYAPTYFRLRRLLRKHPEFRFHFVLPAIPSATMAGSPLHYRAGMAILRRIPLMWVISKAFLVVVQKTAAGPLAAADPGLPRP